MCRRSSVVEHQTFNLVVRGSIPLGGKSLTIYYHDDYNYNIYLLDEYDRIQSVRDIWDKNNYSFYFYSDEWLMITLRKLMQKINNILVQ